MRFIAVTMAIAGVLAGLASFLSWGWVAATAITFGTLGVTVAYVLKTKDSLLKRLLIFGLSAGFAELPIDYFHVSLSDTLTYPPGGFFVWDSPLYMPFAWGLAIFQLSYLFHQIGQSLVRVILVGAIVGGSIFAVYEFISVAGNAWYYHNSQTILGNAVPAYVVLSEVLLCASLPIFSRSVAKHSSNAAAALLGLSCAVWISVATLAGYAWLE